MSRLALLSCLLFFAQRSYSLPCSEAEWAQPCTPDDPDAEKTKQEILGMLRLAKQADPDIAKLEAIYRAARKNQNLTAEEKLAAFEPYRVKKTAQNELFNNALREISALYGFSPLVYDLTVAQSPDPKMAWISGLPATWDVIVTPSGPNVKLAFRIKAGDKDHFGGVTEFDPNAKDGRRAITVPDGRTFIAKSLIDDAIGSEDFGLLASTLYHEAKHYSFLQRHVYNPVAQKFETKSWASQEEDERDAYKAELAAADVFGLSDEQKDDLKAKVAEFSRRARRGPRKSFNPPPQEEDDWALMYAGDLPTNSYVDLDLKGEYEKLQSDVEKQRNSQEEIARREEERRQQEELEFKRNARNDFESAARSCDLPLLIENGRTFGFDVENVGQFRFTERPNPGQTKAVMLMLRACIDGFNGLNTGLCTDGISPMQENWSEPDFLHGLEMDTTNGQIEGCLRALRRQGSAPRDIKELNFMVGRYRADWRVTAGNRMRETESQLRQREAVKQQEENDRRERWADRNRRIDRNEKWDLTPAYEALERARRAHF